MLFSLALSSPVVFLIIALVLIMSLSVHEFAHAWMADRLGDPTPQLQGRVTLNPLAHLDPMGTVALLLVGFSWGKPVMFDPYNLKHPKQDTALIALAGPISNLILAVFVGWSYRLGILSHSVLAEIIITQVVSLNVMLAVFNLMPVYPLDGEKVLRALLPKQLAFDYANIMRQYGMLILLLLIMPIGGTSAISSLIGPLIHYLTQLFLG